MNSFAKCNINRLTIVRLCPLHAADSEHKVQFPRSIETFTNWESSALSMPLSRPMRRQDRYNHKPARDEQSGYARADNRQYEEAKSVSFIPLKSTTHAHFVESYDTQSSFSGSDSDNDSISPRGNISLVYTDNSSLLIIILSILLIIIVSRPSPPAPSNEICFKDIAFIYKFLPNPRPCANSQCTLLHSDVWRNWPKFKIAKDIKKMQDRDVVMNRKVLINRVNNDTELR